MPIIFGWGRQTTWNVGPVFKQNCNHCNNEEWWVLLRKTTWFSLFFIPIIPYETQWLLLCPICKYGIKLNSEQVHKFQPIAEINQQLNKGEITELQYKTKMGALMGVSTQEPEQAVESLPEVKETAIEAKEKGTFCGDCGNKLLPDGRFCVHCGAKLA